VDRLPAWVLDGRSAEHEGIELRAVPLDDAEFEQFYSVSNAPFGRLYHDAVRTPESTGVVVPYMSSMTAMRVCRRRRAGANVWCTTTSCSWFRRCSGPAPESAHRLLSCHIPFTTRSLSCSCHAEIILEGLLGADLVVQVQGGGELLAGARRVGRIGTDSVLNYDGRQSGRAFRYQSTR